MYRKLLLAILGFLLTCNLALAETTTFKDLENNVYDVQELTKIGADYEAFSGHVTELGLALGRYKREINDSGSGAYEYLIKEAAEIYIEALDNWRKSLSSDSTNENIRDLTARTNITLRDAKIKRAAKKISDAEALKNTIK